VRWGLERDCFDFNNSAVAVNINGFGFFGREPFAPVRRTERRIQFQDNFSILKGGHSIKFGGDYNHIPVSAVFQLNFGGVYNFGPLPGSVFYSPGTPASGALTLITTGLAQSLIGAGVPPEQATAIASSVGNQIVSSTPALSNVQAYGLGVPQNFIQGFGDDTSEFSNNQISLYAQDSWRIRPNFTLNYGVRYDVETPPSSRPRRTARLRAGRERRSTSSRASRATRTTSSRASRSRGTRGTTARRSCALRSASSTTTAARGGVQLERRGRRPGAAAHPRRGQRGAGLPGHLADPGRDRRPAALRPAAVSRATSAAAAVHPADRRTFEYGYSQQANLTVEREIIEDYSVSASYLYVRGLHLNRPRDINTPDISLLIRNRDRAVAAGLAPPGTNPFTVSAFRPDLGVVPAALSTSSGRRVRTSASRRRSGFPMRRSSASRRRSASRRGPASRFRSARSCSRSRRARRLPRADARPDEALLAQQPVQRQLHVLARDRRLDRPADAARAAEQPPARLERGNSYFDQRHRFVFSGVFISPYKWSDDGCLEEDPRRTSRSRRSWSSPRAGPSTSTRRSTRTSTSRARRTARTCCCRADGAGGSAGLHQRVRLVLPAGRGPDREPRPHDGRAPGLCERRHARSRAGSRSPRTVTLELIGEVFNLFNRVNIIDVNNNFTVAGVPTAAGDPRQFQFGVKIGF
jgi:hypothetical protein